MNNFYFFIYKKKFLIIYIVIGILSIFCELLLRNFLIVFNLNSLIYNYIPLLIGIAFAFYFNIRFNFSVPKIYLKRSLTYFFIISLSSFFIQKILKNNLSIGFYDYNYQRFFFSGVFFIVGYFFHTVFTFKKLIKVGVAIYANGYERLDEIKEKIGNYPDFIHVDIVDNSMKSDALKIDISKLNEIKEIWPNKEIHTHIMSKNPKYIIDQVYKFSKIIYFHYEINENLTELKNYILKKNREPGLVLMAKNKYQDLDFIIDDFKEVMILSIDNPGYSGQKFNDESYELINQLDKSFKRKNFNLLVDGGVNSKIIKKINCEKIVSGAAVLNSRKPIYEIMKLQTVSRYESI